MISDDNWNFLKLAFFFGITNILIMAAALLLK